MTRNMWFIDCWVYNVWHLFLLPLGGVWSRDIRLHCCCWALTLNWQAITNVSPRLFLLTVKCISFSSSQHIEQSPSAVRRWNGMKWATPYDVQFYWNHFTLVHLLGPWVLWLLSSVCMSLTFSEKQTRPGEKKKEREWRNELVTVMLLLFLIPSLTMRMIRNKCSFPKGPPPRDPSVIN